MAKKTTQKLPTQPGSVLAEVGVPLKDYMEDRSKEIKQNVAKSTADKLSKMRKELTTIKINYFLEPLENETPEEYAKRIPHAAHDGDIGMDVVATGVEYDESHDRYIYHTGFYTESSEKIGCKIMPRSSNSKTDSYLGNGIGLVDVLTYRGEYLVVFKNRDSMKTLALLGALSRWNMMPWYKKLFKNFAEFVFDVYVEFTKDALSMAPYKVGDKIGQLVFEKFPDVEMTRVESKEDFSKTDRGDKGFGSTGK